ncbi:pilin [Candidatus Altiarchaeota archaeon]
MSCSRYRRILVLALAILLLSSSSSVSAFFDCNQPCEEKAPCPETLYDPGTATYRCERDGILIPDLCVAQGYDNGKCGGYIPPYKGYCDECMKGCEQHGGCAGLPDRNYACYEFSKDYFECRPMGYDHGCCGFKPGGGVCDECDQGCPLADDAGEDCPEDKPYYCQENNWPDRCVSLGYDNGCCGGKSCVDHDRDNDCVPDEIDNCLNKPNENQSDVDFDCDGDVCDSDADNDGLSNKEEGDANKDGFYEYALYINQDLFGDTYPRFGDFIEGTTDPDPETASKTSMTACDTDSDGIPDGIDRAFEDLFDILTAVVGLMASFYIVFNGLKWISASTPKDRASAKAGFMYVILGLIVFLIAQPLVGYLLASTGSTCQMGEAQTCVVRGSTTIIYPKEETFGVGRPVVFAAASEFGRAPESYEWHSSWTCDDPSCQNGEAIIGNSAYFTLSNLSQGSHELTLTIIYEDGEDTDTIVFGVSPLV